MITSIPKTSVIERHTNGAIDTRDKTSTQSNVHPSAVGAGTTPAPSTGTHTLNQTPSTQPGKQAGVHPSAVGSGTAPNTTDNRADDDTTDTKMPGSDEGYPEQKHAGKVGYGPNYNQGAGFLDKVTGLKEEIKGKLTKNPELVEHGKDRRTGELKHKEMENDDHDPFATPEEKKNPPLDDASSSTSIQDKERNKKEQAATVSPEGTDRGETQRKGEAVESVKQIG